MLSWLRLITLVVCATISNVHASRILFLVPVSSKSHNNFYLPIAEALAERGHEVKYGSLYPFETKKIDVVVIPNRPMHTLGGPKILNNNTFLSSMQMMSGLPEYCLDGLATKEAQGLFQEKWDLVLISVFFNDCFLYQVNRMQVPYISMIPNGLFEPFAQFSGTPMFPSFMGSPTNPLVTGPPPYTFLERTMNIVINMFAVSIFNYYYLPRVDSICRSRGLCTEDDPYIGDIRLNSSLVIINSIRASESYAAPYPPTVIHAGGIHLKSAKPLSQDLEEWVSGSGDAGFIFFSLGSVVRTENMPEHIFNLLVKVLGSVPQRVLWKWDADPPKDLPSNIRMGKWLPQQDLLGHPSIRLFITHGGLHSAEEAEHHNVPIIGMPVFGDQHSVMRKMESNGLGRMLLWEDLTEDLLLTLINDVIKDKSMKAKIAKKSALMLDLPVSSKDTAVFWVEYVIRHNGAYHLRCPAILMPWYRLYNVDVWATILTIIVFTLFLSYKILRACCKCICSSKKVKSE